MKFSTQSFSDFSLKELGKNRVEVSFIEEREVAGAPVRSWLRFEVPSGFLPSIAKHKKIVWTFFKGQRIPIKIGNHFLKTDAFSTLSRVRRFFIRIILALL